MHVLWCFIQVVEVVDADTFETHCAGHPGNAAIDLEASPAKSLCIIAFLPDVRDTGADGRKRMISMMK